MATQRTSFDKLQRDRAKKAKAAAKREKRLNPEAPEVDAEPVETDGTTPLSPAELLALVETVHKQFEAGVIDLDTFEEKKQDLLARLPVD